MGAIIKTKARRELGNGVLSFSLSSFLSLSLSFTRNNSPLHCEYARHCICVCVQYVYVCTCMIASAYIRGLSQRCCSEHRPLDWLNKDDKSALTQELRNARGHSSRNGEHGTSCTGVRGTPNDQQGVWTREKNTVRALL